MTNNKRSEDSRYGSMGRRRLASLPKVPLSTVGTIVSRVIVALFSAYMGSKYAISDQRALHQEHAAALREVIRFEATQNIKTLKKSTVNSVGLKRT